MQIFPVKTHILQKNFPLTETFLKNIQKNKLILRNGDILVVSSKVVALSEGRLVDLRKIQPSARAKRLAKKYRKFHKDPRFVELILREADKVFPGDFLTTLKDGVIIPAAGIDRSNAAKDFAILWPKNPWGVAKNLWENLAKTFRTRNLGVVISDSHCQPLRWGTTGLALAWAGFFGVEDARGERDIFGKKLKLTRKAVADNLASAALLVMGEAGEKIPFVIVRAAPVKFTKRAQKKSEIFVEPEECVFGGIYSKKLVEDDSF
jgi:coenzyme F420-0:L-glutamate ligase